MILCIVGPTAVGKTKLSIALAKIYNGEIINADSVQIYQGFDIGSAKVTKKEMQGIPHHLLDIAKPTENYTIFDYQKDCRNAIKQIEAKGKIPILVGGSGLYMKAALYNYEFKEEHQSDKLYTELSNDQIYEKIKEYDPEIKIEKQNRRRLVRTLNKIEKECYEEMNDLTCLYEDVHFIGLSADTQVLYQKINTRLDDMIIDLVDEVNSLYKQNIQSKAVNTAIGYKELYAFFDGKQTLRQSVEQIKQNTRNYAKRQYTFFHHQLPVNWVNVNYDAFDQTIKDAITIIEDKRKN